MMVMAYNNNGVIATDRVPPVSTVTAAQYRKFLQNVLRPKICQKSPLCLHDNARPHTSGAVSEILEKYGWQVLLHPPYSPNMSPPGFDFFPKLKKPLRGESFRSIEEVSNEMTRVIKRINNEGVLTGIQDFAQTLDRYDKAQWRLQLRPVNVFCKINSFLKRKRTVCRIFEMTHVHFVCKIHSFCVLKEVEHTCDCHSAIKA